MPDSQQYTWNYNNVEDIVVFLTRKVINSDNFSIAFYKQELSKSLLQKNRK